MCLLSSDILVNTDQAATGLWFLEKFSLYKKN